jgi:hypothetical protein
VSKKTFVLISLCVGIAAAAVSLYLAYDVVATRRAAVSGAQDEARLDTLDAAARIGAELQQVESIVGALATEVGEGRLNGEDLADRIAEILAAQSGLSTIGIVDEAAANGAGWSEPAWREDLQVAEITYSVPVSSPGEAGEGDSTAVAYATTTSAHIQSWIDILEAGKTGWGMVLTQEGRFVSHPVDRVLSSSLSAAEIPELRQDEVLSAALADMVRGGRGMVDHINLITGQASWIFYEPVVGSDWSVAVVRIKEEVLVSGPALRREVIWLSILTILALHCLAVPLVGAAYRRFGNRALWVTVVLSSLLLVAGTAAIRAAGYRQSADTAADATTIVDPSGLDSILIALETAAEATGRTPVTHVPTGIFVQSMEFTSPRNLLTTGFVWQELPAGLQPGSLEGVVFPDAVSSDLTEAYVREQAGQTVIGWYFEVTLRQNLKLSRYPFDHDNLAIRLWPEDLSGDVILVPDLGGYETTNPTSTPGLDADLVLSGWRITGSFFEFRVGDYNTDFGIPGAIGGEQRPELVFNVSVTRNLVDVLLANGIPLTIVLLLLFAALMTVTSDETESKILGLNPAGVMRLCSAFFFVVLLAHIQLRNTISVQEIMFLEYFYFSVYLAILLVPLHAFLFLMARSRFRILEYEDSLIFKLLYWPLIAGFQFLVTAIFFY